MSLPYFCGEVNLSQTKWARSLSLTDMYQTILKLYTLSDMCCSQSVLSRPPNTLFLWQRKTENKQLAQPFSQSILCGKDVRVQRMLFVVHTQLPVINACGNDMKATSNNICCFQTPYKHGQIRVLALLTKCQGWMGSWPGGVLSNMSVQPKNFLKSFYFYINFTV